MKDMIKPPAGTNNIITTNTHCESLGRYFINKVKCIYSTLDSKRDASKSSAIITPPDHPPSLPDIPPMSLKDLDVLAAKVKSSSPDDPVKPDTFRKFQDCLLTEGRELINRSLQSSVIPKSWKHAKVIPLLKSQH